MKEKRNVVFETDIDMVEWLKTEAVRRYQSVSSLVRQILYEYKEKQEQEQQKRNNHEQLKPQ